MKRWAACILSVYILFSAVVPCSIFDNCDQEAHAGQTSDTNHKKDCSGCSPFSICSAAYGFIIGGNNLSIEPITFNSSSSYSGFYFSCRSEYYSSFFQPPRFV